MGSSSRFPAVTSKCADLLRGSGTGEPQVEQNTLVYPGGVLRTGASNLFISCSPSVKRKPSRATTTAARNAEPLTLRQRLQWQSSKGPITFSISNFTPPQRQLPRIIA